MERRINATQRTPPVSNKLYHSEKRRIDTRTSTVMLVLGGLASLPILTAAQTVNQPSSQNSSSKQTSIKNGTNQDGPVTRHGEVVYVSFMATDQDLIQLDDMQDAREIRGSVGPDSSGGPKITDAGLAHLKNLKELEVLDLNDTLKITDVGLSNLAGLTQLRELKFNLNRNITSAGLERIEALRKLRVLELYGAPITDAGLEHIQNLVEMEDLQLGLAPITDAGLVYLERFPNLRTLDLQGTMISDAGLVHLKALSKLEWLCINKTKVTDAGLVNLRGLTSLRTLYLAGTQVTPEGEKNLSRALPNLKYRD